MGFLVNILIKSRGQNIIEIVGGFSFLFLHLWNAVIVSLVVCLCVMVYCSVFQISMGIPLHRIKDIRVLYGMQPWGDSPIDFDGLSTTPCPRGHVIAARITSENPDEVCESD